MVELYHYTCEHGCRAIGEYGDVLPAIMHTPSAAALIDPRFSSLLRMAWFTDLDVPMRDELGLTMGLTLCDRTRYRYRVLTTGNVFAWLISEQRRLYPELRALEYAYGAMPRHWYIATGPVPVIFDPMGRRRDE